MATVELSSGGSTTTTPAVTGRSWCSPTACRWTGGSGARSSRCCPATAAARARLVEIADSATLVPEDQPEKLVEVLIGFLTDNGVPPVEGE